MHGLAHFWPRSAARIVKYTPSSSCAALRHQSFALCLLLASAASISEPILSISFLVFINTIRRRAIIVLTASKTQPRCVFLPPFPPPHHVPSPCPSAVHSHIHTSTPGSWRLILFIRSAAPHRERSSRLPSPPPTTHMPSDHPFFVRLPLRLLRSAASPTSGLCSFFHSP